jgi:CheY-like chemotaxis protein
MSRHILLIDDEEDIREVTATSLEIVAGWRVTTATCGREGVEMALQVLPDAILMDVMMPEQDGPATLRLLRSHKSIAHIPVIFLSAKAQPVDRQLKGLGAAGTLPKPFDPLSLAQQVTTLLGW